MVKITRIGTAKPLACKTDSAGTQNPGADGRSVAQSPSTLKPLGVGEFPVRCWCAQVQSSPAPGPSQIPPPALSPWDKECWRGDSSTKANLCFQLIRRSHLCPAACPDAHGEDLQCRCHRSHPSAAATRRLVPTSGKPKPTTNIAVNPTGNT